MKKLFPFLLLMATIFSYGQVAVNINKLPTLDTFPASNDYFAVYDTSSNVSKKVSFANIVTGVTEATTPSPFDTLQGMVVPSALVDVGVANFVFGSRSMNYDGDSTHKARMFFDKTNGAFRAGFAYTTEWDDTLVGYRSAALGGYTIASGSYSFATGANSEASGSISTAMGQSATASGANSVSLGDSTKASGDNSFSSGNSTIASGAVSTAMGNYTLASGDYSTALGLNSVANKIASTAMGSSTTASGSYSTAMGGSTTASGSFSTAMGNSTTASGSFSTAMGSNSQATFNNCFASGYNSRAINNYATAMGSSTTASGSYSTAMGGSTTASGSYSTAMGNSTTASGFYSTAMGRNSVARGQTSTSIGRYVTASSFVETAIGSYGPAYTPADTAGWNVSDRLFGIYNGTADTTRSSALVVLKSGRIGIGTVVPDTTLHLVGKLKYQDGTQGAGKVLTSNAAGVASWQQPTGTTSLDSATIYALSPTAGTQYYCTDCSGNGITGRIVAYISSAWRRLLFD